MCVNRYPSGGMPVAKRERNKEGKKEGKNGAKKNGTGKNAKATDVRSLLRVPPGTSVDLSAVDSSATPGGPVTKQAALAEIEGIGLRLAALQERLFAQSTAGDRRRQKECAHCAHRAGRQLRGAHRVRRRPRYRVVCLGVFA